ncbi:soluble lytic murein transglycosylase-like protein [Actinoplanes lutulentus]|uniref:NlpC/P60 family protein n=1 Tax=Actinoplanes lutulentus TaxID=1287878 RepID=A0A327ZC74_9ACTN|nr:transglycosylase SLT domain-containing protein [Actinoplanes lutulentus]MBB2945862.1 soluble lytic murein transglycosylase-like protein [Actinoplanes lutulentus]RAK37911.1 NlpC/P60 family protein [Actinoplanes lutulentus]
MTSMGVNGVISRVAEIKEQLGLNPPPPATVGSASGTKFASALADATGAGIAQPGKSGPSGADVVAAAKKYLGTPYVFGSDTPSKGLDCSGLVQQAYEDLGVDLPRNSWQQAKAGRPVGSMSDAKPGDILAFNSPVDHVAIYLGDNKMIAAPKPGDHVKIQSVYEKPSHIRRVLDDIPAAAVQDMSALRPAGLRAPAGGVTGVPYADLFNQAASRHGISPKLLAAVAKVESGYNPQAVSKAGAQGMMQLMPATARGLGVKDAFDPAQAVEGAAKLLSQHLKEFKSVPLALAAYNAGGGAVHKYDGIPPFAETQAYVPKVQKALAALGG